MAETSISALDGPAPSMFITATSRMDTMPARIEKTDPIRRGSPFDPLLLGSLALKS